MANNGTPEGWRQRDDWKYGKPRTLVVSERPPLDPDPLYVVPDERMDHDTRIARLVAAAIVLGILALVIREALP